MPEAAVIDSVKHPAVRAARSLSRPAGRSKQGQYLIEGEGAIHLALDRDADLVCAFVADADELGRRLLLEEIPWYTVTPGLLFKIIGTSYDTAIRAVGVVRQRTVESEDIPADPDTIIVAGESVQDPRNVGVLIRTSDAAGASALILSEDSGDPFSRAAVRSSTGSILCLPIGRLRDLPGTLTHLKERSFRLISSSAHADRAYWDVDLTGPVVLVLGNESKGVSDEVRALADEEIGIPMLGAAHSLNVAVAAGILLYECVRQRREAEAGGRRQEAGGRRQEAGSDLSSLQSPVPMRRT